VTYGDYESLWSQGVARTDAGGQGTSTLWPGWTSDTLREKTTLNRLQEEEGGRRRMLMSLMNVTYEELELKN
jgi:hypothetical protein